MGFTACRGSLRIAAQLRGGHRPVELVRRIVMTGDACFTHASPVFFVRAQNGRTGLHMFQHAELLKQPRRHADARPVIQLHRLHGNGTFVVNADLIELVEACPDTVVTLVNRHRYVVEDTVSDVVARIVDYRARIAAASGSMQDNTVAARVAAIEGDSGERAA